MLGCSAVEDLAVEERVKAKRRNNSPTMLLMEVKSLVPIAMADWMRVWKVFVRPRPRYGVG